MNNKKLIIAKSQFYPVYIQLADRIDHYDCIKTTEI